MLILQSGVLKENEILKDKSKFCVMACSDLLCSVVAVLDTREDALEVAIRYRRWEDELKGQTKYYVYYER